ncbi:uncharacterized protein G2W53_037321 [Senna tora]|uniref:Uncharacterized protein n=1 Tax=Senna tora TaxID=362788 RepID=A0A834SU65_9FABA|nr:uncharacterized protein G2W53_037321 [Senna tora]
MVEMKEKDGGGLLKTIKESFSSLP